MLIPVAYVIFRRENQVLLQQRRGTGFMDGYWAAGAAGHVEPGESVHQAACREAFEELGLRIEPGDLEPLTVLHRAPNRVDFFFQCTSWEGQPRRMEPGKAASLRWFGVDELPTPAVPHELHVLAQLRAGLPPFGSLGDFTPPAGLG
ncbi:NUDIX hydrolase [Glutamicibacter protophormiae]|uniref:NUDIX hydrolase n=1 Tax=Glutamicibacter protophormiae TaxID=37930 RepID=UPI001956ADC0|nr:NUDIX domain-containing protein [Glutamicibacter protophormiae]QRQ79349.1 NUDIX domain-containing protein [Glutamicibacter protophormiae]